MTPLPSEGDRSMLLSSVAHDPRSGDIPSPRRPADWPQVSIARPRGVGQALTVPGPRYSPEDLMGEVYFELWSAGRIPSGPMRDPEAAQRACAALLAAFGIEVVR